MRSLTQSDPLETLLNSASALFDTGGIEIDIIPWAEGLLVDGRKFSLTDHEYQRAMLLEGAPRQCFCKGAQVGVTTVIMLQTMHSLLAGKLPQGALYLFPTRTDVQDFSRGRFSPLINDNDELARYIQDTDAQTIKRVGRSMLYFRGARATGKISGLKRSSAQLKSIPVDRLCLDESDEFEPAMIDLAKERLSHSSIKQEIYLSTPSIPNFGIDRLYQNSDQRVWMLRCGKCGKETCLELEFPACLDELPDGRVIRLCQRCRDREIHPKDGRWVPLYPDKAKDMVGWRISQLNSMFVEPGAILKAYHDPPNGNISEVYNSKLAQAHISAENRLNIPEVLQLCDQDHPIAQGDSGPCFMGVDVGNLLHVVIGKAHYEKAGQIVYIGSFPDWDQLDVLMRRFSVGRAVIDALPEQRLSKELARRHPGKVYCCFYQEHLKGNPVWNEKDWTVKINRTVALDTSHAEIVHGKVILPAECETLHEFARHLSNMARVLQTDIDTGSTRYTYIKTGPDHFRHAQSYECMARQLLSKRLFPEFSDGNIT